MGTKGELLFAQLVNCEISRLCEGRRSRRYPLRPSCWPPGLSSPRRCPLTRTAGADADKLRSIGTPERPRVVRSPAFELALSTGRSGWDRGRPPTKFHHHQRGDRYGFVLERLPSSGRTRCGVFRLRQQPSAGLSAPLGWAKRCPKLRKTCALSVWMRSVDDWPLAKILTRFPGVSRGR